MSNLFEFPLGAPDDPDVSLSLGDPRRVYKDPEETIEDPERVPGDHERPPKKQGPSGPPREATIDQKKTTEGPPGTKKGSKNLS